jgi:hypothetical protein
MPRRRSQQPDGPLRLEDLTDKQLEDVYWFSEGPPGYQVQPDDWRRAAEILEQRAAPRVP